MKTLEIVSVSDSFAMGYSNEYGHFFGNDIIFSDGSKIREVYNDKGELIESYSF